MKVIINLAINIHIKIRIKGGYCMNKEKKLYNIIFVIVSLLYILLLILRSDFIEAKTFLTFDIDYVSLFITLLFFLLLSINIFIYLCNFKAKYLVISILKIIGMICSFMFFLYVGWWALFSITIYFDL